MMIMVIVCHYDWLANVSWPYFQLGQCCQEVLPMANPNMLQARNGSAHN